MRTLDAERLVRVSTGLVATLVLLLAAPLPAKESDDPTDGYDDEGEMSLEEISRMLDNPLGNLWIIFLQNDLVRYQGKPASSATTVNTALIQPVMPVPLTENWNLISRPIIPILSAPEFRLASGQLGDCPGNCDPDDVAGSIKSERRTEIADIFMWSMLSPAEPPTLADGGKLVWGLGPAFKFPSATDDQFGSEKFSIGPSNILLRLPPEDGNWTFGFFHQSVFSVAGEGNRKNVAQTQIQPIYWYSLPLEGIDTPWSVGGFPMININWEADNDNALTLPLEIAASATVFIGPMPVRLIFGINYWVVRADDYGPRYGLKFAIAPVIPRLVKNPILGFLQ